MIVQNISQDGVTANITFTVPNSEIDMMPLGNFERENNVKNIKYESLRTDEKCLKKIFS